MPWPIRDNVNCAKHKFSFYGEDFYPSDYPRFCEYLEQENKLSFNEVNAGWAQKQAEYCYQMNRAAVDFFRTDSNSVILEYDHFTRNKSVSVEELSNYLGIPCAGDYVGELERHTGPVTGSNVLSHTEYESILCYDDLYSEICKQAGVTRGKNRAQIRSQYEGNFHAEDFSTGLGESTTNRLRAIIRQLENRVQFLEQQLAQVRNSDLE